MAHKTLVGGTAYENKGGRCLVDGTAYSILKGRTLVDGTGYDVSFAPAAIPVTIAGSGNSTYCKVTINGVAYTAAATLEVFAGDVITCNVSSSGSGVCRVTIDGEEVASATGSSAAYDWTVPEGLSAIAIELNYISLGNRRGYIYVTTA